MKGIPKDKLRVKKIEGMLSSRASEEVPLLEGCHIWRGRWTR